MRRSKVVRTRLAGACASLVVDGGCDDFVTREGLATAGAEHALWELAVWVTALGRDSGGAESESDSREGVHFENLKV